MLGFPSALKVYLAIEPVDMRKQFNGLWTLAEDQMKEDPRQGALFVFTNKPRDRLKMLCRRFIVSPLWPISGLKKISSHTFPPQKATPTNPIGYFHVIG